MWPGSTVGPFFERCAGWQAHNVSSGVGIIFFGCFKKEIFVLNRYFIRPTTVDRIQASWLGDAIERYVAWLGEQSYAARNIFARVPILFRFGEFAEQAGATNWRIFLLMLSCLLKRGCGVMGGSILKPSTKLRRGVFEPDPTTAPFDSPRNPKVRLARPVRRISPRFLWFSAAGTRLARGYPRPVPSLSAAGSGLLAQSRADIATRSAACDRQCFHHRKRSDD